MTRKRVLAVVAMVIGWSWGASALPANNPITAGLVTAYEYNGNADDLSEKEAAVYGLGWMTGSGATGT